MVSLSTIYETSVVDDALKGCVLLAPSQLKKRDNLPAIIASITGWEMLMHKLFTGVVLIAFTSVG